MIFLIVYIKIMNITNPKILIVQNKIFIFFPAFFLFTSHSFSKFILEILFLIYKKLYNNIP